MKNKRAEITYRYLIIDDNEYLDKEIQMIQTNLNSNKMEIIVYQDIVKGNEVLCTSADIKYSYNQVLCAIGDAYIGENSENPI